MVKGIVTRKADQLAETASIVKVLEKCLSDGRRKPLNQLREQVSEKVNAEFAEYKWTVRVYHKQDYSASFLAASDSEVEQLLTVDLYPKSQKRSNVIVVELVPAKPPEEHQDLAAALTSKLVAMKRLLETRTAEVQSLKEHLLAVAESDKLVSLSGGLNEIKLKHEVAKFIKLAQLIITPQSREEDP